MPRSLLPLVVLLVSLPAAAQRTAPAAAQSPADVCSLGVAEADLDAGGVRARLYTIGGLFWRGDGAVYEVPKGGGVDALFSMNLMIGGLADGELRFAGSTYGPYEFWPGPLDANALTNGALCAAFDRIWTVSTADLAAFADGGAPTGDLADWPVGVGAPFFVDGDGDGAQGPDEPTVALRPGDDGYDAARRIDLDAGERPVVFGAQTAWWVMNDRGGPHEWSHNPALGVEVRVTAWTTADADRPDLYHSTFYRYDVLNRTDDALDDAFAAWHVDGDLGNFNDDYGHADPDRSMLVYYNGDGFDEGSEGYGVPPAIGVDVLSGGYSATPNLVDSPITPDVPGGDEMYATMQGLWSDGTPFRTGGDGYNTDGPPTRWLYHGEPGTYWSEDVPREGSDRPNIPGDRRGMISAEIGRLGPGEEATLDVGILFAQGGDRLDSVRRLKAASDDAQARYASGDLFRPSIATDPPPPPPAPTAAPVLIGPADGAAFADEAVTFSWEPVAGATGYRLEVSATPAFSQSRAVGGPGTTATVPARFFAPNRTRPFFWRVVPYNLNVPGPPSAAREVTAYRYEAGPLPYGDGVPAFVEVAGPGGADPCGPDALSTDGCDEVFGNGVYGSPNSTGDYALVDVFDAAERIGEFVPNEFEVRFTEAGSIAYHGYSSGRLMRVPFEVWDVGQVAPGTPNDPADDVRLVPVLYHDAAIGTDEEEGAALECVLAYNDTYRFSDSPVTPTMFAIYPADSYDAYEAVAGPIVAADPDGCPVHPATGAVREQIDFGPPARLPIYGVALEQASDRGVDALEGTVVRLYTADPATSAADHPDAGPLALSVFPNPVARTATVAFEVAAAGPVAVRVVDVLGREVAVLAEGDRAAGPHRAALPSGLAPGVYLVVLDAHGGRAVRAVTVVR